MIAVYLRGPQHGSMRVSGLLHNGATPQRRARVAHPNFKEIDTIRALRLINDGSMPIHEIARQLGVSIKTLYKRFPVAALRQGRRCNGKPFDVEQASALLAKPDLTVKEIAAHFGVSDTTLRKHLPVAALRGGRQVNAKDFDRAEAERLLRQTPLPVTVVAARVGISVATLYAHMPVADIRRLSRQTNTAARQRRRAA